MASAHDERTTSSARTVAAVLGLAAADGLPLWPSPPSVVPFPAARRPVSPAHATRPERPHAPPAPPTPNDPTPQLPTRPLDDPPPSGKRPPPTLAPQHSDLAPSHPSPSPHRSAHPKPCLPSPCPRCGRSLWSARATSGRSSTSTYVRLAASSSPPARPFVRALLLAPARPRVLAASSRPSPPSSVRPVLASPAERRELHDDLELQGRPADAP